jgi:hypothetical protein
MSNTQYFFHQKIEAFKKICENGNGNIRTVLAIVVIGTALIAIATM